jgi:HPt (histidine-containing phosphotransfer) domain-containing protein
MKQVCLMIIAILSLLLSSSYAQDIETLSKDVKEVKERVDDVDKRQNKLQNSIKNFTEDQENLKQRINKALKNGDDSKSSSIKNKKELITNSSNFSNKALVTLNGFSASLTGTDLLSSIVSLNNPTNTELGFSLENAIKGQVDELMRDKIKSDDAKKVNSFIGQLLNNPITEILKTSVPVINNVVNFVTNLSFNNKKISADDLKVFLNNLSGYFKYYESLSENNQEFAASFNEIKVKLAALEMLLRNYIDEKVIILYKPESKNLQKEEDVNGLYRDKFTPEKVSAQIAFVEKDKQNTEIDLDDRLKFPTTTSSQAQYLYGEFESIASQYINAYKKYVERIKETLDLGKKLNGTPQLKSDIELRINEKRKKLEALFDAWQKGFTNNINLYDLRKAAESLAKIPI